MFDARVRLRLDVAGTGQIGRAKLEFGQSVIMLSDEYSKAGLLGPRTLGGTSVSIHRHVSDADVMLARRTKRVAS